jgi:hypothetical protein
MSFVLLTSVSPIGLVISFVGSGSGQDTLLLSGWLTSLSLFQLFLCIGNMVFFRSVFLYEEPYESRGSRTVLWEV